MELITGRTGVQHVKAIDDAEIYKSVFGNGDYVLETGAKFNASMSGTNAIIIQNGTAIMQGRQVKIREADGQETLAIDTGTAGYKRWDVVCIEYNISNDIESAELVVIKGSTSQDWQEPTIQYEDGDIDSGETHRMKLWGVKLDGINFDSLVDYRNIFKTSYPVIVIEKEEEYSAHDSHGITIQSSELQGLGVDDLDNYSVISFRWKFGINNSWTDTGEKARDDDTAIYPRVVSSTYSQSILIQPYNRSSSSTVFFCRLVLMKVK